MINGSPIPVLAHRNPDLPRLGGPSAGVQANQAPSRSPAWRSEKCFIRRLTKGFAGSAAPKVRKNRLLELDMGHRGSLLMLSVVRRMGFARPGAV